MSSQDSNPTVSGAFGGEMKYFTILMMGAAGILFASMFLSAYLFGPQTAGAALFIGLILAGIEFFGGWLIIYVIFQQKNIPFKHFLLVIRLSHLKFNKPQPNFLFHTHHKEKRNFAEIINGKPTGWRGKTFELMEPVEFNPGYADFGVIREFTILYYGRWADLVIDQPGDSEYRDLSIPVGSFDVLTVMPAEGAYLNIKHGERSPVFRLIGGGWEGKYSNPPIIVPHPDTHILTVATTTGQSTALTITEQTEIQRLQKENEDLRTANMALASQAEEATAYGIKNEQIHLRASAENSGIKDLLGETEDTIIEVVDDVVSFKHSWERAASMLHRGDRLLSDFWVRIILLSAIIVGFIVFITINPQLADQAFMATQNPLVCGTIILVALFGTITAVYYFKRKNKKGRK